MAYNGSGTFNITTAGQPVVTGTVISSTAFNALTADLATGLSTAITKDGQTTTTSRILFAQGISSTLTTDATSTTTGSIITAGGISCQKAAVVGTNLGVGAAASSAWASGAYAQVASTGYGLFSSASTRADAANVRIGSFTADYLTNTATYQTIGVIECFTQPSGTANKRGGYWSFKLQPDNTVGPSEYMQLTTTGLGIGMTPTRVLDITQSQNAASIGRIFNGTSGTAGSAEWRASNKVNDSIRLISINQSYTTSGLFAARKSVIASDGVGLAITTMSAQAIQFGINNTEAARFDTSGNLLVGTTSSNPITVPTTGLAIIGGSGIRLSSTDGGSYMAVNATSGAIVNFYTYNGGAVIGGNISQNGGTTAFNATSDYRLKENVEPLLEGIDTIALLKPVKYNWVRDGLEGKGFIAHELQAVIPLAVTGKKDAMNDDGTILAQGVDFGKIVPHLVVAIQELTTRLAALENK